MNTILPPVAVRTAYFLARELSPQAIALTRRVALNEIEWPTELQRRYVQEKYDLALRIAEAPLQGPPPAWCDCFDGLLPSLYCHIHGPACEQHGSHPGTVDCPDCLYGGA